MPAITPDALDQRCQQTGGYLCVGLDPVPERLPEHLSRNVEGVRRFLQEIIAATAPYAVAYKVNFAFFEALGREGWALLEDVRAMLPAGSLTIADAKRGDIGTSSAMYAKAVFEQLGFDAITVAPYMGHDSVAPFLDYAGKWVFLLALTSNPGSADFEQQPLASGQQLYQAVLQQAEAWPRQAELGYVVGATQTDAIESVRSIAPQAWLLVPGVGAQGGSLEGVLRAGRTPHGGLLINSSRGILYASSGMDFAQAAAAECQRLVAAMRPFT